MKEAGTFLAVCLKTYPCEDDMADFCDGKIVEPSDVKIYFKGKKYLVTKDCNKDYYRIIDDTL